MAEQFQSARPPVVALVGRPNVGKSRLFNRYAGRSRALVENTPGVTRDRVAAEVEVEGRRILIVDTAGLDAAPDTDLSQAIQAQARTAVAEADGILFVVDGRAGLLPEDEAIAQTLRRSPGPLSVLVNKLDTHDQLHRTGEFHRLGLEPVCGASGEHGLGAFDALEELVGRLPPAAAMPEPAPDEEGGPIRIALVGRPNVGKSTLMNRLLGEERVVVSEEAGTTRDSVDIVFRRGDRDYELIDTAGLRRQGRRDRLVEHGSALMTLRSLERAQVAFLVIDASLGFSDQDGRIANLAMEQGCAIGVLANKWDRVASGEGEALRRRLEDGLRFVSHSPILRISALRGTRTNRILALARKLRESAQTRVPTADLNRWLREATARHEPAMAQRGPRKRPIKFFYATQTGVGPPRFVLFCTEPASVRPTYVRFLENQLRAAFGFDGTPVRLQLRARGRGKGPRAGS